MRHRRLLLLWAHRAGTRYRSYDTARAGVLLPVKDPVPRHDVWERRHGRPVTSTRLHPQIPEDDAEHVAGSQTKCGRRARRETDRRNNGARVRHSYLKIRMEDHVLDQLHTVVRRVGQAWKQETRADANEPRTISKKQSKRQLSIQPRSRDSLHMTYFFAGQVLADMTGEEVQRWEYCVRNCVAKHNDAARPRDYFLRFRSLAVFPPNRHNLIVAVFEPSAALSTLYDKLCDVAVMESENSPEDDEVPRSASDGARTEYAFPGLRDLTRKLQRQRSRQASPRWIAHVTLGSLAGGKGSDVERLSAWLNARRFVDGTAVDISHDTVASAAETSSDAYVVSLADIDIRGLALGGPVPDHVDIDWNFSFER